MGGNVSEGDQSLYFFTLNKDYKDIIDTDTLNIHDRVRSIIYIKKINKFMIFLENKSLIGFLEKLN